MVKNSYINKGILLSLSTALVLSILGCSSDSTSTTPIADSSNVGNAQSEIGTGDIGSIGSDEGTYSVESQSVKLPEKFSIVLDPSKVEKQAPTRYKASYARAGKRAISFMAGGYEGADTDYSKTEANIWDANFENTLDFPNYLASLLAQSKASEFVNQGKYIAMFDAIDKPFGEGKDAGAAYSPSKKAAFAQSTSSESSNNQQKNQETAIFEVIQANPTDPLTIKMWVDVDTGWGMTASVYGETLVTQNQSEDYPLGEFGIYYTMVYKDASGNIMYEDAKNALLVSADSNNILVDFKNVWTWSDPSYGYGSTYEYNFKNRVAKDYSNGAFKQSYDSTWTYDGGSDSWSDSYDVAYDVNTIAYKHPDYSDYSYIYDENATRAYATDYYDINDKKQIVYNYDLFNEADGSRVKLNTGTGIRYTDADGVTHYGYASPWGTWIDGNIENNQSVTSDFDDKTYTATVYRGRLEKQAVTIQTMADIGDKTCDIWAASDNNSTYWNQYSASWDTASQSMIYDSYYDENYNYVEESGTLDFEGGYLWCGRQSYEIEYSYEANITNATEVKSYEYITITPDTATDLADLTDYSSNSYTFNASEFMLKDSNGEDVDSSYEGEYVWKSLRDASDNIYYWSISDNDWDKSVLLKDVDGVAMSFDEPLFFNYTHTLTNDRDDDEAKAGTSLEFEYYGYGLYIPWDCSQTDNDYRCGPKISLKDGAMLSDSNNNDYVVKATDIGVEYTKLDSAPDSAPEFLTVDLTNFTIDTGDFAYEDAGDTSALEIKVKNKVLQEKAQ